MLPWMGTTRNKATQRVGAACGRPRPVTCRLSDVYGVCRRPVASATQRPASIGADSISARTSDINVSPDQFNTKKARSHYVNRVFCKVSRWRPRRSVTPVSPVRSRTQFAPTDGGRPQAAPTYISSNHLTQTLTQNP